MNQYLSSQTVTTTSTALESDAEHRGVRKTWMREGTRDSERERGRKESQRIKKAQWRM